MSLFIYFNNNFCYFTRTVAVRSLSSRSADATPDGVFNDGLGVLVQLRFLFFFTWKNVLCVVSKCKCKNKVIVTVTILKITNCIWVKWTVGTLFLFAFLEYYKDFCSILIHLVTPCMDVFVKGEKRT